MSRISIAISAFALAVAVTAWLFSILNSRSIQHHTQKLRPRDERYVKTSDLLDARSLFQDALRTIELQLQADDRHSATTATRLLRLLYTAPALVASPVVADIVLADIEKRIVSGQIWIVTNNDIIEFPVSQTGGAFAGAVLDNLEDGVRYRYLVADSEAARKRAHSIESDFPAIEIRFVNRELWKPADLTVDEFVLYADQSGSQVEGYYLYPNSSPPRWIKMDNESSIDRLEETQTQWSLALKT